MPTKKFRLSAHPLERHLEKSSSRFTKEDIIKFIEEKGTGLAFNLLLLRILAGCLLLVRERFGELSLEFVCLTLRHRCDAVAKTIRKR